MLKIMSALKCVKGSSTNYVKVKRRGCMGKSCILEKCMVKELLLDYVMVLSSTFFLYESFLENSTSKYVKTYCN